MNPLRIILSPFEQEFNEIGKSMFLANSFMSTYQEGFLTGTANLAATADAIIYTSLAKDTDNDVGFAETYLPQYCKGM